MAPQGGSQSTVIALSIVMVLIAVAAYAGRLRARKLRGKKLWWDDWMVLAALIIAFAQAINMWLGVAYGGLGKHSKLDANGLPFLTLELERFWKVSWISVWLGNLGIGLTKMSVLLLYVRIFGGRTANLSLRVVIWSLFTFAVCWTIAMFFASFLECIPISQNWIGYGYSEEYCINQLKFYYAMCWTDMLSDVAILLVPIPSVWSLRMSLKRKIAVTGMFLLGAITLAISISKLVLFYQLSDTLFHNGVDVTYFLAPTFYWPLIETCLGATAACLPLLKPVVDSCGPLVRCSDFVFGTSRAKSTRNTTTLAEMRTPHGASAKKNAAMDTHGLDLSEIDKGLTVSTMTTV